MILRLISFIIFSVAFCVPLAAVAQTSERPNSHGRLGDRRFDDQRGGANRHRAPDKLNEGDKAIDFTIRTLDGKKKVRLSNHRDKKPVALVFGSYT